MDRGRPEDQGRIMSPLPPDVRAHSGRAHHTKTRRPPCLKTVTFLTDRSMPLGGRGSERERRRRCGDCTDGVPGRTVVRVEDSPPPCMRQKRGGRGSRALEARQRLDLPSASPASPSPRKTCRLCLHSFKATTSQERLSPDHMPDGFQGAVQYLVAEHITFL